jgi:hypothetical protein
MPCYRCGVRQTDPGRGQSPWKRGVRRDSQILICPACQGSHDWTADLDRCGQCSSVHLIRRLGEVECRDCGAIVPPVLDGLAGSGLGEAGSLGDDGPPASAGPAGQAGGPGQTGAPDQAGAPGQAGASPDLSEEVAKALERVLGRSRVSQSARPAAGAEPKVPARPRAVTG